MSVSPLWQSPFPSSLWALIASKWSESCMPPKCGPPLSASLNSSSWRAAAKKGVQGHPRPCLHHLRPRPNHPESAQVVC
ncbi:hypothetical protein E2C01_019512 [Portunus trituberculatus]|uniref:Uncharacterized protein n=1 Tax=Portunus trituberculatus TaxID=210409 RepID=A0A5B7DZ70_PORTR|nr:hypothetical protein [Portunus trituberculatus]